MTYLLAKIFVLLLLAALLGALLARWRLRRYYEDVTAGLERIESGVRGIEIPKPVATDLGPIQNRLTQVEQAVKSIAIPPVDFTDTTRRLDALERAIRAIVIPPSTSVDLSAVMAKLDALAAKPAPAPAAVVTVSGPTVRAGSRNLLTRAHYGKPDDLKLINGVKEAMEKMLHDIGVYYFWQIAEWTHADIVHADAQLTAFHGRIARDNWVDQAAQLLPRADSARKPASL